MTTRSTLAALRHRLRALQEALGALCLALDDLPDEADEPAVVDALRSAASEIEDCLGAALAAGGNDTRIALQCQEALQQMQRASRELASHANLLELSRLAAERGGPWRRWSEAVREALETWEETLALAAEGVLALWRELVDRGEPAAAQGD